MTDAGRDTDLAATRRRVERAFSDRPHAGDERIADSDSRYEDYEGMRSPRVPRVARSGLFI